MTKFPFSIFATLLFGLVLMMPIAAQQDCRDGDDDCQIAAQTRRIQAEPNNAEAYYTRALAYKHKKQYELEIRDLDKYLGFPIDNKQYLADGYRERAWAYHKANDVQRALADLDKAIAVYPDEHEAYYTRGQIYSELKNFMKAIADYTKYIELNAAKDAYLADGYYGRGYAYNAMAKYSLALADLNKAIDLKPSDGDFYTERAFSYRKLGKVALAEADEAKAAQLKQN